MKFWISGGGGEGGCSINAILTCSFNIFFYNLTLQRTLQKCPSGTGHEHGASEQFVDDVVVD